MSSILFIVKTPYASNLPVWWWVVANLYHTYSISGSHLLRSPLLPPFRDK